MSKIKLSIIVVFCLLLTYCGSEENRFPINKRYWTTTDYNTIVNELSYGYKDNEKLPTFNDPETRIIIEKLTDHQNYLVVLDDEELGLKHRSDVSTDFFENWRSMSNLYSKTDRRDKYVYEKEMLRVYQFGLGVQLRYFKLNNDRILEEADDPNSKGTKNTIDSNVRILIQNYLNYLDEVNNENAYSSEGKKELSKGIDVYFSDVISVYPDANYKAWKNKIILMEKKSNSPEIKEALNKLLKLIENTEAKEVPAL